MTVLGTDKPCLLKCPQLIGETFQIELEFWTCWQTGVSGEKVLVADNQQQTQPQLNTGTLPQACLVPVRRFPSPSRSIHFGDVSEANGRETFSIGPRDPKRFGRA